MGPALRNEFPEVELAARFLFPEYVVKYKDNISTEKATFTDPDFLKMFSFNLLMGNPDQVLRDKNTIIVSEDIARKYFGDNNPIGKQVTIIRIGKSYKFTINGVIENAPENSSIQYDILLPFEKLRDFLDESYFSNWGLFSVRTYVQLHASSQVEAVNSKLPVLKKKYIDESKTNYYLQPLPDIHFAATVQATMTPTSSITYSYILAGITLLILLIASFNSMNISTVLASMRYKEIGVRKVMGAFRSHIIIQFCCETVVLTIVAFILGIFLAELFLPIFNSLANITLKFDYLDKWYSAGWAIIFILSIGILPGIFPAFLLSRYPPADLYQRRQITSNKSYFSRSLITIQFGLSIFLIICTLVMSHQLNYLKTRNLGFNDKQIIVLPFHGGNSQQTLDTYRTELNQYTNIINVSGAISCPGGSFHIAKAMSGNSSLSTTHIKIDYDFLETFGITLKEGRNFSRSIHSDTTKAIIINEAFANHLGWHSAIGKKVIIEWMGWELEVIGVIKDFHYTSLHEKIGPLVFYLDPYVPVYNFFVKIKPEEIPQTLALLKSKWHQVAPDHPFEYFFLDQKFDQLYRSEERWNTIVKYSSILAVFIACFGLFGLSALVITKRTKEIGIRKVVGATVNGIILLLSKEFTKWIVLANIFAWPCAYFAMNHWLQNFAYKVEIGSWEFILAGGLALLIALLTVSSQAIKAALANPVEALRYE
jgi:putative ABC transport system permease protein